MALEMTLPSLAHGGLSAQARVELLLVEREGVMVDVTAGLVGGWHR